MGFLLDHQVRSTQQFFEQRTCVLAREPTRKILPQHRLQKVNQVIRGTLEPTKQ